MVEANSQLESCENTDHQNTKLVQTGTVVKLEESTAVVRISVSSACAKCHAKCTLAGEMADRYVTIPMLPQHRYQLGEQVDLEINSSYVVNASFLLYFIPTIILIIFAYLGNLVANYYRFPDDNLGTLLGIVVAIPLMIMFIYLMQRKYSKTHPIKVIPRSGANG